MIALTYTLYLTLSVIIVLYVGNFCYQNGKKYILHYFSSNVVFGNSINKTLRIAYYCLNIGLSVWNLQSLKNINSFEQSIVEISTRFSLILLIIGILHFTNILTIYFIYKHFKNN